jgi:hypothetical protein
MGYEYDSLNRLTKVKHNYSASTWPLRSISISSESVSYQYDGGSGLKTQMVDSSGTSSYTYDTVSRLATYTPPAPEPPTPLDTTAPTPLLPWDLANLMDVVGLGA